MESRILAFCDPEEEYTLRLTAYLSNQKEFPWQIQSFTRIREFLDYMKAHPETESLVAESIFPEVEGRMVKEKTIVLNESGYIKEEYLNINKYQAAKEIGRLLVLRYAETKQGCQRKLKKEKPLKIVGVFSPVGRSMQTSFALCYGHCISKQYRTLFLSFEYYCGHKILEGTEKGRDLMSLLYYLKVEREKFGIWLHAMGHSVGGMDYISPVTMGQNLVYITAEEWMDLFQALEELGEYDYLVLDLSEGIQGLYDILGKCSHIYTMTQTDPIAKEKINRYEQLIMANHYEHILEKTRKCAVDTLYHLPENMEEWSKTELFLQARQWAQKDMGENGGAIDEY